MLTPRRSSPARLSRGACVLLLALASTHAGARAGDRDASAGVAPVEEFAPFPQPDAGYVTDLGALLTADQEERIERWLWQVESRSGVEIIVVTLRSIADYPGTPNASIERFASALFDRYGIGNLPSDDGVLLLVAAGDRKARIELGKGYGAARDRDAARIMDDVIVPEFRGGDFPAGIEAGVKAIAGEFAGARIGFDWLLLGLALAVPALALIAFSLFRNGKRGWGWIVVGLLIIVVLVIVYLLMQIVRHLPDTRSRGWLSGGLGGFGGGSSGGGGATGSW